MERYLVIVKQEGETPLQCVERWRKQRGLPASLPLAYAGRLDPMASGKLLVLIGDECKVQAKYHALDKEYQLHVLLGVSSDTGDILGHVRESNALPEMPNKQATKDACKKYRGTLTLPYPLYSAKTVAGKPLHMWASEGRSNEIEIPTYQATIYRLQCIESAKAISRKSLCSQALKRIELPTNTASDTRKKAGNNFRRDTVRAAWTAIAAQGDPNDRFYLVTFVCTTSAGMYMRTLAEHIACDFGTTGLAYRIVRTEMGRYRPLWRNWGIWQKRFR